MSINTPRAPAPPRRVSVDDAAGLFNIVQMRPWDAPAAG
ncbi:hypothetical protein SMD11_0155 [Streptomyces albireticuli]|uniref:Uncharacterized protein n=1 Tax=Streptomyces albireticuli TaxID=1940 RepID=A0A1Z2KV46_9ACTN|nr:hypothetical protein SMD11_0155 [Streptomyces albireticuli]